MNILKSLIMWLCFIPVAILNGGLREYVLAKAIGEEWALPVSGITLSVCIFLITWLLLPRMIKAFTSKDGWLIGIGWALLTIAFEFAAGLAGGSTVLELLAAYNPLSGNLWLLVLATTLLSPIIVKQIGSKDLRKELPNLQRSKGSNSFRNAESIVYSAERFRRNKKQELIGFI